MYGLEGILGNLITSVATPAVGGIFGEMAGTALSDVTQSELLKDITQTTTGALAGAGVGAGLGALTGGKSGALSGAITGGVGGGLGGYNADDIAKMFGTQQSVQPPLGTQIAPEAPAPLQQPLDAFRSSETMQNAGGIGSPSIYKKSVAGLYGQPDLNIRDTDIPGARLDASSSPYSPPAVSQPSALKGYADFLKQNYEPLAGGFYLGSAYGSSQDTQEQAKKFKQQQALRKLIEDQQAHQFAQSVYGYADGGPVNVGLANPAINIHFPAWAQEDFQREGGLAALQPGMNNGFANGGYINTQPFEPQQFYPQSRISSAQPYAAAGNTRVIDTLSDGASFARGGLIDGQGDGMSDDIPANISGQEEVRVADGEYLVPKEVVAKYGDAKLKAMLAKVRHAAHAKKGSQLIQDAGKKAFIQTLSGIKA